MNFKGVNQPVVSSGVFRDDCQRPCSILIQQIIRMDEKLIEGSVEVVYNKFGSAGQKMELPKYACELGTIPRYQNAEKKRIVQELRVSSVYSQLNN